MIMEPKEIIRNGPVESPDISMSKASAYNDIKKLERENGMLSAYVSMLQRACDMGYTGEQLKLILKTMFVEEKK